MAKDLREIQIEKAAANFLSDQEDGSLFDAYVILTEEIEKGNGKDLAANHVTVWEKLQDTMTVENMVDAIECAVIDNTPEFFNKIDWEDLKGQKLVLLKLIDEIEKCKLPDAILTVPVEAAEAFNGILHLIDSFQDYAVDVLGIEENLVFDLHPDE